MNRNSLVTCTNGKMFFEDIDAARVNLNAFLDGAAKTLTGNTELFIVIRDKTKTALYFDVFCRTSQGPYKLNDLCMESFSGLEQVMNPGRYPMRADTLTMRADTLSKHSGLDNWLTGAARYFLNGAVYVTTF